MKPGDRIADRFELLAEAGAGGMGTVYRARDFVSGDLVAVKVLRSADVTDTRRFVREAVVLAELSHPSIVRYIAHGTTAAGRIYLAMELLDGQTLAERTATSQLSLAESLQVVREAALALDAAHRRGVVHRDIKPSNLFLCGTESVRTKVLDFGIARFRASGHTVTMTGGVVGTPQYMAPEQARSVGTVDGRADLYALGAVLFELITGQPPFSGASLIAVLAAVLLEETPRPSELRSDVPEAVDRFVYRLLQKNPDDRPADAAMLVEELDRLGDVSGLLSSPSLRPPALTDSERRLLCVIMTAPIRDWSASAPTLRADDETASDAKLREVVAVFGGEIEFLADGSVVATVAGAGSPSDHASRAAECAVAMRRHLPNVPMALVAGRGAIEGRVPVGEVIARGVALLEAMAESESRVRADNTIVGFLSGRMGVIREGAAVYLSPVPSRAETSRRVLGREVPFVGRRREMSTLFGLLEESSDEPVARAVVLTGSAGSGKSRLVRELLTRVTAEGRALRVLRGNVDPMRDGSPFAALSVAVRETAAIVDGEPLADRRQKLEARLSQTVPAEQLPRIATFLGELCRVPSTDDGAGMLRAAREDAQLMGDSMRKAFEDWLAFECAAGPVLLVLEDLHFGDPPTIAFVDAALRHLEEQPLFVLATGRPALKQRFPGLWEDRDAQELRLGRLTKRASRELVASVLEDAERELAERLVDRAEGNPFYLEELIRAVSERDDGALPETVVAMVQSRLDALPPQSRRLLRAASVFGDAFWEDGLVALIGGRADEATVADHLLILAGKELVARRSRTAFPGEVEWTFSHSLVREAAYAALTEEDQRLGHRLAGQWLEGRSTTDAFVLAEHHRRGDEPARAVVWFVRAAEQALEANDFLEAERRAGVGLSIAGGEEHHGALWLLRAEACRWRARYDECLEHAKRAVELLPPATPSWYAAIGDAVLSAGRLGNAESVEAWTDAVEAVVATEQAERAHLVCLCRAAAELLGVGEQGRAAAVVREVVRRASEVPADPVVRAWVHTLKASLSARDGYLAGYLQSTDAAADAYEVAGALRHAANQRVRLGYGLLEAGQHERAEVVLRAAHAGAVRLGTPLIEIYALQNLGHALGCLGRLAEARDVQQRGLAVANALGDEVAAAGARFHLAHSLLVAGDAPAAALEATHAVEGLEAQSPFAPVAAAMLARALIRTGDRKRALELAEASAARFATLDGLPDGDALVRLAHAEALRAAGRQAEARRSIQNACKSLRDRAERILDDELRRSFLGKVPEHRRTFELERELSA